MSSPPVFLSNHQPLRFGRRLARGGEGEIFDIDGRPGQVAKRYHRPLSDERRTKLGVMAQHLRTPALLQYTAWPLDTLHHGDGQVCGFVMEKLGESHDIHELYSVKSRQRHFPGVDWRMLVRTALNTARAFAALHQAGFIIGDVNHGSVRVMPGSFVVKLIDTDSFQIRHEGHLFPCVVGMPEFTPPELQGISFRTVTRSTNHDSFGLAVLIFQLLMNGWHPFSGVYSGSGEMTLKRAIQEMRYAHSQHADRWHMRPPPACLPVAAASPQIAALWEAAFGRDGADHRPTAQDWVRALSTLETNIAACPVNPTHHYWAGNAACPWCEMARVGIVLFGAPPVTPPPLPAVPPEYPVPQHPHLDIEGHVIHLLAAHAAQYRLAINSNTHVRDLALGSDRTLAFLKDIQRDLNMPLSTDVLDSLFKAIHWDDSTTVKTLVDVIAQTLAGSPAASRKPSFWVRLFG